VDVAWAAAVEAARDWDSRLPFLEAQQAQQSGRGNELRWQR